MKQIIVAVGLLLLAVRPVAAVEKQAIGERYIGLAERVKLKIETAGKRTEAVWHKRKLGQMQEEKMKQLWNEYGQHMEAADEGLDEAKQALEDRQWKTGVAEERRGKVETKAAVTNLRAMVRLLRQSRFKAAIDR